MLVNIKETLERVVEVESVEEAEEKWHKSEIILDAEDFKSVEFVEHKEYPQLDLCRAKELIKIMIADYQEGCVSGEPLSDDDVINYLFTLDFTEEELLELGFSEEAIDSANEANMSNI